jgi:Sortase domain
MIQPSMILSKLVHRTTQRMTHALAPGKDIGLRLCLLVTLFLLMGCQPIQAPSAVAEATATPMAEEEMAQPALPPTLLRIPDLSLELPITPMGWQVIEANGQRTTEWLLPVDTVGWQVNSAAAGAVGNTILIGHQSSGAAILAPLALGDIVVEQEVHLVDESGAVFRYQVTEVSEPIAIVGATEEDNALAQSYVASTEVAQLTLMTGWPDFTTTHRIFAVAEYLGPGE